MKNLLISTVKDTANKAHKTDNIFQWAPRVLSMIYIFLLMLFSLDAFSERSGFWGIASGLFMHNIPALILLIVLIVSWKYEIVGGIVFNLSGILYAVWLINGQHPCRVILTCLLCVSVPALITGVLFLAGWIRKRKFIKEKTSLFAITEPDINIHAGKLPDTAGTDAMPCPGKMTDAKTGLIGSAFAVLLLAGAFFYMAGNIMTAMAVLLLAAVAHYFVRNRHYELAAGEEKKVYIFLICVSAAMMLFRFYRICTYPYDYFGDELTDIVDTYTKISGGRNFFSYVNRQGAAMPLVPETVYSVYIFLFRSHIEFIRTVPLLIAVVTAIGMYYLGKTIRDKKLGIIFSFLYAVSGWTLFSSRELIGNAFIPLFAAYLLLVLSLYIRNKDMKLLIPAWLIFFAGFFTYTSWVLMVPILLYLIFEYRKELGKKTAKGAAVIAAVSAGAAAVVYLHNGSLISWSIGRTVLAGGGNTGIKILYNLRHLPDFFVLPAANAVWFTDKLPLLSFTESAMLLGGTLLCLTRIKERPYRILLVSFFISLFTLFISDGNHPRHMLALPFMIMISGVFLRDIIKYRYSIFLLTLTVMFFINTAFYMFFDWNTQIRTDKRDISIAEYVNDNYKGNDYIFMYTTIPLSLLIGEYSAYMHTGIIYKKIPEKNIRRVLFTSSSLLRYRIRGMFPGARIKYFYDYDNKGRLPIALYDVEFGNNTALREFFIKMSRQVNETSLAYWSLDYGGTIKKCEEYCERTDNDGPVKLKNTFLRYTELKALEISKGNSEMNAVLFDREKPMFLTGDWAMRISEAAYLAWDLKNASYYAKMAANEAPEWDAPKEALKAIAAREKN